MIKNVIGNDERLREIYQLGHDPGDDRAPCPSPDALARAAAGEASPEERLVIARHLMSCSACSTEFREAAELPHHLHRLPGGEIRPFARVASYALAAAAVLLLFIGGWALSLLNQNRDLSSQLAQSRSIRPIPAGSTEIEELRRESASQLERIARLEAEASRLGAPTVVDQPSLAGAPSVSYAPSVNVSIIDLDPSAVLRGESRDEREVAFPSGAAMATLILNTRASARYDDYSVTMTDRAGKVLSTSAGLIRSPDDTFTLTIPKLPDGRYKLIVAGLRGGKRVPLEDYAIRISSVGQARSNR